MSFRLYSAHPLGLKCPLVTPPKVSFPAAIIIHVPPMFLFLPLYTKHRQTIIISILAWEGTLQFWRFLLAPQRSIKIIISCPRETIV
jgi:hypothetical protein